MDQSASITVVDMENVLTTLVIVLQDIMVMIVVQLSLMMKVISFLFYQLVI